MAKRLIILILLECVSLLSSAAEVTKTQSISICIANAEYPPYNYVPRNSNTVKQNAGYDIDLLRMTFEGTQFVYTVQPLPWKRCQEEVKKGNIDALMSASSNQQRRQDFYFSEPYYYLTPSFFYLKADFPDGLTINNASELERYGNICGIKGFNYHNFGMNDDHHIFKIGEISQLPYMLLKGRCKFFLARQEILVGTLALNQTTYLADLIEGKMLTSVEQEPFYMLIGKSSPYHKEIKQLFDRKVKQLTDNGKLRVIIEHHLQRLNHHVFLN
ncbi:transporter substrate-binding domain-containing protein [Shewanella sp. Isolate11]|uniref:substrate-binding periplasmic protein n=1 Tax=Shewanella sp. Isolate11 TaxID=2908530 RepID=UPI001EFCC98D|nr:transporter substrate-binding domain-containing protein [Shewanella sp. Isolate11]MCG9695403.1 transporter substrate-binding domain-containing protein [Shewanella sp. Isolate11]